MPVAKAPLFRHPLIGPLLRLVGALPVHRRQEGGVDPARNRAMCSAATAPLGAGQAVLIFPEGVSHPDPALMPLRTDAARMLLEAAAAAGGNCGVALVPVGFVFHEPGTFPRAGRAFLPLGVAVATADCIALHAIAPEGATPRLTDRLTAGLRQQIMEADDRETLRLLRVVESMSRDEAPSDARGPAARTAWSRVPCGRIATFVNANPGASGTFALRSSGTALRERVRSNSYRPRLSCRRPVIS